ncbi:MAG: hypothetical protein IBX47_11680 [Desulfuromonadales bacterium]|nr:hypothetical protein [Desulfuromonadales bacterium]
MSTQTTPQRSHPENEQGFILIITMLVLVVLTILCIGALDNSTFEVQIAANDRAGRVAFNLADGGVYAAGKLLGQTIESIDNISYDNLYYVNILDPNDTGYSPTIALDSDAVTTIPNAQVSVEGANRDLFNSRIKGYVNPGGAGTYDFMLRDPNGQGDIYGRITERSTKSVAGGGAEFGSGSSGVGSGSSGSTAVTLDVDIDSYAARNTRAQLAVRYRKVLGAAGGL